MILTLESNGLAWTDRGTTLAFTLTLQKGTQNFTVFNDPWRTLVTLRSLKGVALEPYSRIETRVDGR